MDTFFELEEKQQIEIIEALIFASDDALSIRGIIDILEDYYPNEIESAETIDKEEIITKIENIITKINLQLQDTNRAFRIVNFAGGYQFAVVQQYGEIVSRLIKSKSKKRLSQAALETLAIIAYKQPISKPMIEEIRGVNSNEVVNSLMDKGFVKISGRSELAGKPMLYSITEDFLKSFGLRSLDDLPPLKEIDELGELDNIEPRREIIIEVDNPEKLKELKEVFK